MKMCVFLRSLYFILTKFKFPPHQKTIEVGTYEKEENDTADEIVIAHNVFLSSKSDRKHSFQDEFIPLFDENKQKQNETEQDEDHEEETESVQVGF
jgi:hypothetical protein